MSALSIEEVIYCGEGNNVRYRDELLLLYAMSRVWERSSEPPHIYAAWAAEIILAFGVFDRDNDYVAHSVVYAIYEINSKEVLVAGDVLLEGIRQLEKGQVGWWEFAELLRTGGEAV